jgi:hypothetical protein
MIRSVAVIDEVLVYIDNRTTDVVYPGGSDIIPIGYADFVNDVAYCVHTSRETAVQLVMERGDARV